MKEVADLAGVSVRTLHHYDDIELLKPGKISEAGYRVYSQDDLEKLQQILFFRSLDFPLKQIKNIISSPAFDRKEALELHRKMLLEKRRRLDGLIETVDKTIQNMKGEIKMNDQERFAGFDFTKNPYEQEARDRWGDKAVDKSSAKLDEMSTDQQKVLAAEFAYLYKRLATLRHQSPDSNQAQEAIGEWYTYLNKVGSYSLDAFRGLGQLYVDDERFTKNIDQYGEGLAVFMRDAMAVYADRNKK